MTAITERRDVSQVQNVVANWGAFAVSAVAGLYVSPQIVAALGKTTYGVWVLIGSLVGPLSILDFGVRSAVTRLISRFVAMGRHDDANRTASTARILYGVSASIALLVCVVLALGMTHWFDVPSELRGVAPIVLVIASLALAITLMTALYGGILAGLRRLDLIGFGNIGIESVRVPGILGILWASGGIVGLAAVGLVVAIIRFLYQRAAARTIYPQLRLTLRKPVRKDMAAIMEISVFSTVIYSLATITGQVDIYVIGAHLPLAMVTYYAIGGTLTVYVRAMSAPIAQNVLTQASHLDATHRVEELRELLLNSGRYGALVIFPVVMAYFTRGPTFLAIWMGPEFQTNSGPVLLVLSIASVFALSRHVLQTVFVGTGQHRRLVPWYIAESLTTVGLCIVFVRLWGVIGAAWAIVVPTVVMATVVFPILMSRHFDVMIRRLWVSMWLRPLAAMVPYTAASWFVDRQWPATGYLAFFGQVGALLPLALAGALLIGVSAPERQVLRAAAARRIRFVASLIWRPR